MIYNTVVLEGIYFSGTGKRLRVAALFKGILGFKPLMLNSRLVSYIEEETDRREGKGRRCCLGDGIHSILFRTTDLAPGRFEEKEE